MKKIPFIIGAAVVLVSVFAWLMLTWSSDKLAIADIETPVDKNLEKHIEYIYEIPVDSFKIIKGIVGRNQMLGNILTPHGVTNRQLFDISNLPSEKLNVRKIKAGNKYALFIKKDSLQNAAYFVYEKDLVNYAVIHFEDSIHVEQKAKPVIVRTEEVAGEIHSSLWESFQAIDVNPFLAVELSEIFAWTIDFFY